MKIEDYTWYRPRDIAKYRLITSSRGGVSYNFVLREIKEGRLRASNSGKGKTPYFIVLGKHILEYKEKNKIFNGRLFN